jgi:hypothetical protein
MCPMALRGPWVIDIKKGLTAVACSNAHVFPRHTRALSMPLQDMRVDGVIMTCKPCGHALQHRATVPHHTADRSQSWRYSAVLHG